MKVLVVDDDAVSRLFLQNLLKKFNAEVEVAENGAQALKKMDGIDLVILDLLMPIMDGITFMKVLNELMKDKKPPIIAVTTDDTKKEEARKAGADAIFIKPIPIADFLTTIEQLTSKAG